MGDGRTPKQFRNSLKNARDTFDIIFDNGRIGWINQDGQQPSVKGAFARVHEEWEDRLDDELEDFVLRLQSGSGSSGAMDSPFPVARTEGGKELYLSVRSERDSTLRSEAIAIHGLDCMGCNFSFEANYGALGEGFIEVHHAIPLADAGERATDPATDLVVLCANCHRMVHRHRGVCLSLDELKAHLK